MNKLSVIAGFLILAVTHSPAAGPFSNSRYSNVAVNDALARALRAGNSTRENSGHAWEIVHGPDDDYFYVRPAGRPLWEPSMVYSRAFGAAVPFPVDYSQPHVVPQVPPVGYSHIEAVQSANPPAVVAPGT